MPVQIWLGRRDSNLFPAQCQLSRVGSFPTHAQASPRSSRQKNPLPYFLRFPSPNFFLVVKGIFWRFGCHFMAEVLTF